MAEEDNSGNITTPSKKKQRRQYDFDNLMKAYKDVTRGKLTAMKASIKYGVPRTTLRDRINGRVNPVSKRPGPTSLLGEDVEKKLRDHIISLNNRGVKPTNLQVLDIANDIAFNKKLRHKSFPLSQKWVNQFVKRWPELKLFVVHSRKQRQRNDSEKLAGDLFTDFNQVSNDYDDNVDNDDDNVDDDDENVVNDDKSVVDDDNVDDDDDEVDEVGIIGDVEVITAAAALAGDDDDEGSTEIVKPQNKKQKTNVDEPSSSKNDIDQYFKDLKDVLAMYKMENKPECIYHLDDKGLVEYLHPQPNIASSSADLQHPHSELKKVVSVIGAGNALGHHIPPFFVFQRSVPSEEDIARLPVGTGYASSSSGWPTMKILREYLQNHFIRYAQGGNVDQPVLVIHNAQKAHYFCHDDLISENNMVMFASPAHKKDMPYPFTGPDCFGPFDILYNCMRFQHMSRTNTSNLTPAQVCKIACRAYETAMTPSNLRQTFAKCGTFPFNPSAVLQTPESKLSVLHPEDGKERQISVILSQTDHSRICGQSCRQITSSGHRPGQEESSAESRSTKKSPRQTKKGKKKKRVQNSDCQTDVSQDSSGLGHSGVDNIDVDTNLCGMCIASTITI